MQALGITLLALGLFTFSGEAGASQPGEGHVESVIPAHGTHPANAAIQLRGSVLDNYELIATIDGEAAQTIVDERLSREVEIDGGYEVLTLRLKPEPVAGQRVTLSGNACAFNPDDSCEQFSVTYEATEPDLTPPDPPEEWWWGVYFHLPPDDLAEYWSTAASGYLAYYASIHVNATTATLDGQGPLFLRAWHSKEIDSASEVADSAAEVEFTLLQSELNENVVSGDFCMKVELLDLAGNTSGVAKKCHPCSVARSTKVGYEACYPDDGVCSSTAEAHVEDPACFADPWAQSADAGVSYAGLDSLPAEAAAAQTNQGAARDAGSATLDADAALNTTKSSPPKKNPRAVNSTSEGCGYTQPSAPRYSALFGLGLVAVFALARTRASRGAMQHERKQASKS
jgi:hypothetical protein